VTHPWLGGILANGAAMLAARLLVPIFSLAINIALARTRGAELLGTYAQLVSITLIFQAIAGAGIPLLLGREFAADPQRRQEQLRLARTLCAWTGAAGAVSMLAVVWYALPAGGRWAAAILAGSIMPSGWVAVQEAFFVATRTHHRVAVIAFVEGALKVALGAAALAAGGGLLAFCAGVTISRLLALAVGSRLISKDGYTRGWRPLCRGLQPFAWSLLPFAALFTVSIAYFRIDVIVLQFTLGPRETGFYAAALTLYSAALLVPDSAMAAFYPRLAAAYRHSREGYAHAALVTVRLLAVLVAVVAVILAASAGPLLQILYGDRFSRALPLLRLLALSLPFQAVNAALGQALQAGHCQRRSLAIATAGLVAHLVGLTVLTNRYGAIAAPISLLLSSMLVAWLCTLTFHRHIAPVAFMPSVLVPLAVTTVPLVIVFVAPVPYALVAGIAAMAALGVGAVAVRALTRADLTLALRALASGPAVAP
jgi:O-antigen/teichoic acid export membrane protein